MADDTPTGLTIDELARETGITVRNIRAHQSRGLLPPPEVRARTGYYGPEHVARLRLVTELQGEGFNLAAITRLLDGSAGGSEALLGFKRALSSPFGAEEPEVVERAELETRLGPLDDAILRKAERAGVLIALGDDRFELPSPTLARAGEEVVSLGIPLTHALAVVEKITRHTRAIADEFVALFMRDVVEPLHEEDGDATERWSQAREALDRLAPLASQALQAAFQQTMTSAAERAFGRELERSAARATGARRRSRGRDKGTRGRRGG